MGYNIKTQDSIVHNVIKKIDERSLTGQAKYGAMMMEEVTGKDKDLNDFLKDVVYCITFNLLEFLKNYHLKES